MRNEDGRYLRVPALDMPWWRADNLDVLATLVGLAVFVLWVLCWIVGRLLVGKMAARALFVVIVAYAVYSVL